MERIKAGPFGVLDVTSGILNYYVDTELSTINDMSGFAQSLSDLSVNSNTFTQVTSNQRPSILNDSAILNKRVLRFDGTNDNLGISNNATLDTGDTLTTITIFRSRAQALNGYLHMKGIASLAPGARVDPTIIDCEAPSVGQMFGIGGLTADTYRIWVIRKDGSNTRTWINSIEQFPVITNRTIVNTSADLRIGSNEFGTSRFQNFDLFLQAQWRDPLSISDIIDLQDGLRERTGIAKVVA